MRCFALAPLLLVAGLLGGCAVRARPSSLADATAASRTDRSREAAELAPTSFAEAERYRVDAERAYESGDPSGAQILGERAIAMYGRAFVHARTVRAKKAAEDAQKELSAADAELAQLKEDEAKVTAELIALETKVKVAKDALPVVSSGPTDPARDRARVDAARAILTEARLLCVSARLIAPEAEGLKEADAAVADVDETLTPQARPVPVDAATRSRAQCLTVLTGARRASAKAASVDVADALLGELSKEGTFSPARDDRGVVVTLEDAFSGERLSKSAESKLDLLGKIAAAHADMPILVVVHDGEPTGDGKRAQQRGDAAKKAIGKARTDKVDVALAGATRPIVDPKQKDHARNERLEIVFVSPVG